MSKMIAVMSVSLDGFVADRADGVAEVFDWYFSGDVPVHTGGSDPMTFKLSKPSAEHVLALTSERGAVLTGRRTFEIAQGWGGKHWRGTGRERERASPGGRLRRGEVGLRGEVGACGGDAPEARVGAPLSAKARVAEEGTRKTRDERDGLLATTTRASSVRP